MPTFSANLGFLFGDQSLPDAIRSAHQAGFAAVECHWPAAEDIAAIREALAETGLPLLGLNTARGNVGGGEMGLSAVPGRQAEARDAIDQAFDFAQQLDAHAVHVMAGRAQGPKAEAVFIENLLYACDHAAQSGRIVLIEPLNRYSAPGYFFDTTAQAERLIEQVGRAELALMFDCFHVQLTEGDLSNRLATLLPIIGHIQFAGVPFRSTPDRGEVNYGHIFRHIDQLGWTRPLGAEYLPDGPTQDSLGWLRAVKAGAF
ncbi:TIM barrel protein [Alphaproteobacteria bacterium]|nr:TIM barrel protein [Alphaproteobacteria bacterium]